MISLNGASGYKDPCLVRYTSFLNSLVYDVSSLTSNGPSTTARSDVSAACRVEMPQGDVRLILEEAIPVGLRHMAKVIGNPVASLAICVIKTVEIHACLYAVREEVDEHSDQIKAIEVHSACQVELNVGR